MLVKILLDGRFLSGKSNGISNDAREIMKCLEREGHELYFLVYGDQNIPTLNGLVNSDRLIRAGSYRTELLKAIFRKRINLSRVHVDIYIQFQISPIRIKLPDETRKIIRIHDLFPTTNPEWFPLRSRFLFRLGLTQLNHFDLLLANSKTTARAFRNVLKSLKSQIEVLQCIVPVIEDVGLCGICSFCIKPTEPWNAYFAVGTFEPRKNYSTLIEGFTEFNLENRETLIIVGGQGWGHVPLPPSDHPSIHVYKDVCDATIGLLYKRAKAFISVSWQEGFNIPLYRAIKMKMKIIVSDIPIHREVVGNYNVLWVNPEIATDLSSALQYVDSYQLTHCPQEDTRDFAEEIREVFFRFQG